MGLVNDFLDVGDTKLAVSCLNEAHSESAFAAAAAAAAAAPSGCGLLRGMTVVWIMLRNRPIVGSTSSGFMTSSSSLNVIRI